MGFFVFVGLKNNNSCQDGSESFSNEPTSEEIERALNEDGMFFCNNYKCRMHEKHCVSYQIKSIEGFVPGNNNLYLYRPCCVNCDQGRQIRATYQTILPTMKSTKKCCLCGKVLPLSEFYPFEFRAGQYSS